MINPTNKDIGKKVIYIPSHCKNKMHNIISKSSFQLKGDCWYNDGYNKNN